MDVLTQSLDRQITEALVQEVASLRTKVATLEQVEDKAQLKDLFISIASHELRTPLTSIKGYSQLLQRNLKKRLVLEAESSDPALRDLLERDTRAITAILDQTGLMAELISEMLDYSKVQTGKLELHCAEGVDIKALVQRVVQQQRDSVEDHSFVFQTDDTPLVCDCDTVRIEQVLNNLLGNAAKYSQPDQPITVGVEGRHDDQTPGAGETANEVVLWVQDEGIGIEAEQQERIFDTFYRAHSQKNSEVDGLGLGLFISREIINRHGGKMWLQSQPGVGSTFYFSLPI